MTTTKPKPFASGPFRDPEQLITDRSALTMEQWPRLDAMWGCANCEIVFKSPYRSGEQQVASGELVMAEPQPAAGVADTLRCPCCGSGSVYDIVAMLDRVAEASAMLDAVIEEERRRRKKVIGHSMKPFDAVIR